MQVCNTDISRGILHKTLQSILTPLNHDYIYRGFYFIDDLN